jgi:L-fuconolactonase
MRIDSHQHFWSYNDTDYVWMNDAMDALRRDYLPTELSSEIRQIGFDGTIAVQARQMESETAWLLELADAYEFILGVVGWVDFASPRLSETLERLAEFPKLRGVRELIHDMEDLDYATSDVHKAAIARLAPLGLTYDLLLKPPHLHAATVLVNEFPEQPFVVDHLAKPNIAAGQMQPWRQDLERLAQHENVHCKLSGMVTEAQWGNWNAQEFRPYLDVALEAFGSDRLMIGSDWPVCTLSGSYAETMQVVIDFAEELTADERDEVLGENAAHFYGVTLAARFPRERSDSAGIF